MSRSAPSGKAADDPDTVLTDALLDQFSAYYLLSVLAVKMLEEARRQRAMATQSAARPVHRLDRVASRTDSHDQIKSR